MSGAPRPRTALRVYYVAAFAGFGAYLPYFPRWLEAQGARGAKMSALSALLPAMGVVAPPLFGMVADALGLRGWLLRVACLGAAVPFLVLGVTHPSYAWLFAGVLFFAFFRAPMTMLADVVALEVEGGAGYGRTRLFGSLGFLASALAVGKIVDDAGLGVVPIAIGGAFFAACVCAFALPAAAPREAKTGGARELFASGPRVLFLGVSFLSQVAHSSYDLCSSLHLRDLGQSGAFTGVYWATGVASEVALMFFSARVFRVASARTLLAVGLVGATLRWSLIAVVTSPGVLLALQPLHALSFGLVWLASLAHLREASGGVGASTAQGFFAASVALGSVVGIFAWGPLYARSGGATVFAAAAIVAALAVGGAALLCRLPSGLAAAVID